MNLKREIQLLHKIDKLEKKLFLMEEVAKVNGILFVEEVKKRRELEAILAEIDADWTEKEKAPIGAATPSKAHNKEINHSIHQCCGKCKEEADAKGVNSTAHQCGAGRCK